MQKFVKIDSSGMFVGDVLFPDHVLPADGDIITAEVPEGFYHPKWDGSQWIEGKSPVEIDAIRNAFVPKTPMQEMQEQYAQLLMIAEQSNVAIQRQQEQIAELLWKVARLQVGGGA